VSQKNFSIPFFTNFILSNCALKTIGLLFGYDIKLTEHPVAVGYVTAGFPEPGSGTAELSAKVIVQM
jgi:hypothetical protein